jgi:hypothetical protein
MNEKQKEARRRAQFAVEHDMIPHWIVDFCVAKRFGCGDDSVARSLLPKAGNGDARLGGFESFLFWEILKELKEFEKRGGRIWTDELVEYYKGEE